MRRRDRCHRKSWRGREGVGVGVFLRIAEFGLWRGANFWRKKDGGGVGCREWRRIRD